MKSLGAHKLADAMATRQLSNAHVAKYLGIHPSTLRRILTGERLPTLAQAAAMERICGIGLGDWFVEDPK